MARTKKNKTLEDLKQMAKEYQLQDNALFNDLLEQYTIQLNVIRKIKLYIEEQEELTTSKEYVKGKSNIYTDPVVKELTKQSDSATKTANSIVNMLDRLGNREPKKSKLDEFITINQ